MGGAGGGGVTNQQGISHLFPSVTQSVKQTRSTIVRHMQMWQVASGVADCIIAVGNINGCSWQRLRQRLRPTVAAKVFVSVHFNLPVERSTKSNANQVAARLFLYRVNSGGNINVNMLHFSYFSLAF